MFEINDPGSLQCDAQRGYVAPTTPSQKNHLTRAATQVSNNAMIVVHVVMTPSIGVGAVVVMKMNFRTANDRAYHATDHCSWRARNDRARTRSNCGTREYTVICVRERRNAG